MTRRLLPNQRSRQSDPLPAKRGGLFARLAGAKAQPEAVKPAMKDKPAAAERATPEPRRKRKEKPVRRPPRPRPARAWSRWRVASLVTKLAVGIIVASFLVQVQQRLPHFEFRSNGTIASSPAAAPKDVSRSPPTPRRSAPSKQNEAPRKRKLAAKPDSPKIVTGSLSAERTAAPSIKRQPDTLLLRTFKAHAGGTAAVRFASGGDKLATIGGDGTLKVWDTKTSKLERTLELEHGPAQALAILGNRALTGHENGRIALWDLDVGMQLKSFKRNDAPITSLTFAGTDKFLAGGHDWSIALWEVATPSVPLHVFEGHGRDVLAVAFEPGRGLIASASADRTVKLWAAKSLSHVRTYPRAKNFITATAFSPDGETLLIGTQSGRISLYSTDTRRRRMRYRGHSGRVTSLQFIDGGREFVSASADGTVRLWNRRRSRARQTFGSAGAKVANAAVSPDGRMIATGKDNGTVQIWNGVVLD